ncbi:MAG: MarC family NAAT transporter [Pusillimonas sp.]|nr:MarC family NAAT transporter [Pusillimonas sp.]
MGELSQLIQIVGIGLSLLLPLANPLTSVSLLLSLGAGLTQQERARQVKQATFYVMGILLVTYYAGMWIMNAFDISMPGMRIAGGMVVAFIGFNMLFPSTSVGDMPEADRAKESMQTHSNPSIAFVPLALPGTAGPGTMAMIISSSSRLDSVRSHYAEWVIWVAPIVIAVLLGALFFVCMRSAHRLVKFVGHDGIDAISRVMGFLLVCMGVQLVINGIEEIVASAAPLAS